ncbi:hypothetical protein LTS08_000530 [Lithohypha guttulata]|uniref:Uncharacterized protein n=1 Tax=Lithohypha guttulata TaxID=1690604 RepID=A0AAN7Y8Y1_9EURO|nr:hypothetical protein LTR51_006893 [Lithohypha guttulata]KAK5089065.1 hypothetical protein LTR05_003289 [Lithohypha guttulata]KAK5106411.1 hypothetical protein LTS08_000530 [Lithohypha guttulata]
MHVARNNMPAIDEHFHELQLRSIDVVRDIDNSYKHVQQPHMLHFYFHNDSGDIHDADQWKDHFFVDPCFAGMFNPDHIDQAHKDAAGFCNNRNAPIPTYANVCGGDRSKVTSAFQCITASATPVPSEALPDRECYKFGSVKLYGKQGGRQRGRKGRRDEEQSEQGFKQGGNKPSKAGSAWDWFMRGN